MDCVVFKIWRPMDFCAQSPYMKRPGDDTSPKTCLSKRMLPLHARVMAFLDTVEEKHYQCAMDNLYKSGTFLKAAYNHEKNY